MLSGGKGLDFKIYTWTGRQVTGVNRRALWKNILGRSVEAVSNESKTKDQKLSEKWASIPQARYRWQQHKLTQTLKGKMIWQHKFETIKILIPFHPELPLLGIYPHEIIRRDTIYICKHIHCTVICYCKRHPEHPTKGDWWSTLLCIHLLEYILQLKEKVAKKLCNNMENYLDSIKWKNSKTSNYMSMSLMTVPP